MSRRATVLTAAMAATVVLASTACTSNNTASVGPPTGARTSAAALPPSKFFSQADYDRQMAERRIAPDGDPNTPWLQMIQPTMVDTSKYTKRGKWHICFSNAAL